MSEVLKPQVLVVGGGPGGYVAAIRCGQLGLDTVLVEAGRVGGTCLIRGCIPSKALIHAAGLFDDFAAAAGEGGRIGIHAGGAPKLDFGETVAWKDGIVDRLSTGVAGLLRKAKVRVVEGWGVFSDAKTCRVETAEGDVTIAAQNVILATGSVAVELPDLPFGGRVISSTEALSLDRVPGDLAVVGAGYIGLELGTAFAKMGARVSIVEQQDRILPLYDAELTAPVERWLRERGVSLHLGATALGVGDAGLAVETAEGERIEFPADKVLVTVGRRPCTQGWGLEEMALAMNGPAVLVDSSCATLTTGVWAIGDLVGEPMLAHKASAQGKMVAEIIAGHRRRFDPVAIPAICFTEPEIVTAGLAEAGPDHVVGTFPFRANGRALTMEAEDGFVRTIADRESGRVLGIHAVGRHVSELSGEFGALLEMGATLEDIDGIIHAHPTLAEAVHESALLAEGVGLHL